MVGAVSRQLVRQCEAESRNNACFDVGADGLQILVIIGFGLFAAGRAYLVFTD